MDKLIILVLLLFVLAYAFSALFKEELHINTLRVFIVIYGTLFGECSTLLSNNSVRTTYQELI